MARVSTQQRLQKIRTSIDIWRWTRVKRSPMPEELWTPAVQIAKQLGVWRAARELGLSYESLRRRVEEKASRTEATMGFVEVRGADLMAETTTDGIVMELSATDGTRLVVRLGRGAMVDPIALIVALRQQAK
jgi:hypothetical protein